MFSSSSFIPTARDDSLVGTVMLGMTRVSAVLRGTFILFIFTTLIDF